MGSPCSMAAAAAAAAAAVAATGGLLCLLPTTNALPQQQGHTQRYLMPPEASGTPHKAVGTHAVVA